MSKEDKGEPGAGETKLAAKATGEVKVVTAQVEAERAHFTTLLLANPNYFGNLAVSPYKAVKSIQGNVGYEQITCLGLNPPFDRLEAVIEIKRETGYGGDICSLGSREYVRFYVDLHNNGVWHDVGLASVAVHDIHGPKPLCYGVKLDFTPVRKLCTQENIVRVLAILSWNAPPPANTPAFNPVYGNRFSGWIQIQPAFLVKLGDLVKELEVTLKKLPDPIGPVIHALNPETLLPLAPVAAHTLAEKKKLYQSYAIPPHRFAFSEAKAAIESGAGLSNIFAAGAVSPLAALGLTATEISEIFDKLTLVKDGDITFEQLHCVGLNPGGDLLEAVFTVKKQSGYSGALCGPGSTEYIAFWMNFGAGFVHLGTATVQVHDLKNVPAEGVQYAAFLKVDLSKHIIPCQDGPRIANLRGILSWETAPPPNNPNYVPVWGNHEDCLVQLRPGQLTGHIPVIETVGDMGINDIDQVTGLASGNGVLASLSAHDSPFGGDIAITGRIGDPPDSFGGGAARFKYRVEVSPAAINDWHPLTNQITVKVSEAISGVPIQCDPIGHPGDLICDVDLTATDDGDGLGDGWYPYLEDYKGPETKSLVVDKLAVWHTNAAMEGLWKIRITAKDVSTSPPTLFPGIQVVKVQVDNTAPQAAVHITGATFNGNPVVAADCGRFPVGTILTGTYAVSDPGTSAPDQHFGSLSLFIVNDPDGGGPLAQVVPSGLSYPAVSTNGTSGSWTLNTADMPVCGYVLRLQACDRTIYNSGFVGLCATDDRGFCLIEPPAL